VESGYRILEGFYGVKVSHNDIIVLDLSGQLIQMSLEVAYLNHSQDAA